MITASVLKELGKPSSACSHWYCSITGTEHRNMTSKLLAQAFQSLFKIQYIQYTKKQIMRYVENFNSGKCETNDSRLAS